MNVRKVAPERAELKDMVKTIRRITDQDAQPQKCKSCNGHGYIRCSDILCSCVTDFHPCPCRGKK